MSAPIFRKLRQQQA